MDRPPATEGSPPGLPLLCEVAVALPLLHTLTYKIPPHLAPSARVGCLVKVPVSRRAVLGYILGPPTEVPDVTLKEIHAVLDPQPRFGPEMVPLLRWLADYYHYPLGEALRQIIPGGPKPSGPRTERWAMAAESGSRQNVEQPPSAVPGQAGAPAPHPCPSPPDPSLKRLGPRALALLAHLREYGPAPVRELNHLFPRCHPVLARLAKRGLILLEDRPSHRDPLQEGQPFSWQEEALTLIPEQEEARRAIARGIQGGTFAPFLLHGVTASGKTEVYLAAAQECLAKGRQVLVLLPEIALTHPVAQLFRSRFGARVALLHSGLTETQRLDQWQRLLTGAADIAVGARSAVFAPLTDLGLIVVDEEHDPSYKHEGGLPYQARDVALYRGFLSGAAVVLVSATPAVTTFHRAKAGKYHYLNLSRRVTPQDLPDIHLVDLKKERGSKGLKVISQPLAAALAETLERGEQALLFLNRRGFATAVFCLFCGKVFQCRDCSVALTQHRSHGLLVCHYCGYKEELPERCPDCQSTAIKKYGVGTERVEAEAARLFPQARIARLDRDTAPHSGKGLKILEDFFKGELDILVGTQMITKGHHFPQVTLVGVIAADLSLFFPEYHAGERTFQLLAQVAGRAGRGEAPGRVIIQTYHPGHYVFQTVKRQDYESFYEEEIAARRELGYPPFTRLALVRLSGPADQTVAGQARELAQKLAGALRRDRNLAPLVHILGPAPAGLAKLKGRFRWQILLKSYGRPALFQTLDKLRHLWSPPPRIKTDLTLDIDPGSLF